MNTPSTNINNTLSERAVLVSMIISRYRAKGRHKNIDQRVTEYLQTKRKAGSTQINLLDPKAVAPTVNAAYNLSKWYKAMTLPWDESSRILPSALHDRFMEGYQIRLKVFNQVADEFIMAWPNLTRQARIDLGDELFNLMDFPKVTQIRSKFGVRLAFLPVPTAGDFRVTLSEDKMNLMRQELDERNRAMLASSMHDAWKRMYTVVSDMADRLNKPKFRNTIISNIRDLTDILPELNLAEDPDMDTMRDDIINKLCRYNANEIMDDDNKRNEVAEHAEKILSGMRRLRIDLNEADAN